MWLGHFDDLFAFVRIWLKVGLSISSQPTVANSSLFCLPGTYSEHSNSPEDRRFKYTCGELSNNKVVKSCKWTSYTDYDAVWSVEAPSGEVMAGVRSHHHNGRE